MLSSGSSISSFFSSASTSSFFSSSTSAKSSTNIPMSQYGQQATSSSEKNYVVGSMTTRKEIEQDAKDDISQFNITFAEVNNRIYCLFIYLFIYYSFVIV